MNIEEEIQSYDMSYMQDRGSIVAAHIADLHFPAMNPQKQYTILREQFIEKLLLLPKLDLVCIDGDIFDHKVALSSDATFYASLFISDLIELVAKMKNATVIILQGTLSHDANQLKIYYHYMNRTDVDVRVVTNIRFEVIRNYKVLCIPELYGVPEEIYQQFLYRSGFYDLCIMHGTIHGAVYGDNVGQGRLFHIEDFLNCCGPIISGHIHKPQCISDHFYYCGSPYRWRFDDDHMKGFILLCYNLNTRQYYLDYQEIFSDVYKTIEMNDLINNNPIDTINYIKELQSTQGINYIRIKFNNPLTMANKMSINNAFRNNDTVSLDFYSQEQEIAKQAKDKLIADNQKVQFLLDDKLTDEQKFVMWVNYSKKDETYLTVEELERFLSDKII